MRYELEICRPYRVHFRAPHDIKFSYSLGEELAGVLRPASPKDALLSSPEDDQKTSGWKLSVGAVDIWRIEPVAPVEKGRRIDIKHLAISLDWHQAKELLPVLISFAVSHELALRDIQKPDGLLWHPDMFCHTEQFSCKERAAQITQEIMRRMRGIRSLLTIGDWVEYYGSGSTARTDGHKAYAVVLRRCKKTLVECVMEFHEVLRSILLVDEHIEYRDRGFWVCSDTQERNIYFCIEAYNHNPTITVHMDAAGEYGWESREPGPLCIEPLYRPGTQRLRRTVRELCPDGLKDSPILRRMGLHEFRVQHKEPGMRLAASVRVEKRLKAIFPTFLDYDKPGTHSSSRLNIERIYENNMGGARNDRDTLYYR